MLFVVIQAVDFPFVYIAGEEVTVVGRTLRLFLVIIHHFKI